jgi:hypothetical protein
VGGWDQPYGDDTVPVREQIAKWLYSRDEGIGLTIYRYNVGAGSADSGKGVLTVHWTKPAVQTTGYQLRLCKRADFKTGVIVKTVKNNRTTALKVTKLSRLSGYYIQIRTYKTVAGKNYFSSWSKSFGRKTK